MIHILSTLPIHESFVWVLLRITLKKLYYINAFNKVATKGSTPPKKVKTVVAIAIMITPYIFLNI